MSCHNAYIDKKKLFSLILRFGQIKGHSILHELYDKRQYFRRLPSFYELVFEAKSQRMVYCTLDEQGSSFFHGVRFSVHTCSRGSAAYRSSRSESRAYPSPAAPCGRNEYRGDTVALLSMKFSDAQNMPDRTFMRSVHWSSTLKFNQNVL